MKPLTIKLDHKDNVLINTIESILLSKLDVSEPPIYLTITFGDKIYLKIGGYKFKILDINPEDISVLKNTFKDYFGHELHSIIIKTRPFRLRFEFFYVSIFYYIKEDKIEFSDSYVNKTRPVPEYIEKDIRCLWEKMKKYIKYKPSLLDLD